MSQKPASAATEAFLQAATYAGELISSDRIGRAWPEPSVLDLMTVGDVAGHLFLVLRRVGQRAQEAKRDPGAAPAPGSLRGWTWSRVESPQDLERAEHRTVRDDSAHVAGWGWEQLRDAYLARLETVAGLLRDSEPPDVDLSGQPISFDAYLATRIVEMTTHADDLACSVGLATSLPESAVDIAILTLVDAARSVHGDLFLLRALARSERAQGSISVF